MSELEFKLDTEERDFFGKGAARKLRAAGRTPVVVYGHGTDPLHLSVEAHPLSLMLRTANALIELSIGGKKQLVLVKDVQKDPVRQLIEHVDLIIVRQGETVDVQVPIQLVGEPFSGTTAIQDLTQLHLNVLATAIPDFMEVSVEGLEEGARIDAGDITLPEGATLLDEPDALVVQVLVPRAAAADDEAAEGEGDAGAAATEESAD